MAGGRIEYACLSEPSRSLAEMALNHKEMRSCVS
jgi:hypothetical protein